MSEKLQRQTELEVSLGGRSGREIPENLLAPLNYNQNDMSVEHRVRSGDGASRRRRNAKKTGPAFGNAADYENPNQSQSFQTQNANALSNGGLYGSGYASSSAPQEGAKANTDITLLRSKLVKVKGKGSRKKLNKALNAASRNIEGQLASEEQELHNIQGMRKKLEEQLAQVQASEDNEHEGPESVSSGNPSPPRSPQIEHKVGDNKRTVANKSKKRSPGKSNANQSPNPKKGHKFAMTLDEVNASLDALNCSAESLESGTYADDFEALSPVKSSKAIAQNLSQRKPSHVSESTTEIGTFGNESNSTTNPLTLLPQSSFDSIPPAVLREHQRIFGESALKSPVEKDYCVDQKVSSVYEKAVAVTNAKLTKKGSGTHRETSDASGAHLEYSQSDVGRDLELFSFRADSWEYVQVTDFEILKELHQVEFPDGSKQWLNLRKKPVRTPPSKHV